MAVLVTSCSGSVPARAKQPAQLQGGGASFPDSFYQAVNGDFNELHGSEIVTYAKSGSADGRHQLRERTLDFAGSDSLVPAGEGSDREGTDREGTAAADTLLFPTVASPIAVSYNLAGVNDLRLTPELIAEIFQARITAWDDPAVAEVNPHANLAGPITVVHRSDGSGTTGNFTGYLQAAAESWSLGSGDTVQWPNTTQGAEKNSGVASLIAQTSGAIGYVDVGDAAKAGLSMALIQDSNGDFVGPTAEGARRAVAGSTLGNDLSYDPLNSPAPGAYPITAPTWIITYRSYDDPELVASLRAYLRYLLTTGQQQALKTGYVGIPRTFQDRALTQVQRIVAG